ncbi:HAMP domain-containing sensor histidine kinase [Angustibacter peucedani]
MRRQIALLVAATTSAVVLAFVVPLGLLVRTLAEDRALASAQQEAQSVSALVAAVPAAQLEALVGQVDERSAFLTTVRLPDGTLVGADVAGDDAARWRRAQAGSAFTVVEDDQPGRVYVPVVTDGGTAVVRTTVPPAELHRGATTAWATIAGLGLLLLALALLTADRLGRRTAAPISAMSLVAHRLRSGDLSARVDVGGPAEVADLGASINRLADRVGELLRTEREAVADLSHRLRTPVTALRLDVDGVHQPDVAERLRDHVDQLQRTVDAIVKDARRPVASSVARSCDATSVVRERVEFWSALAADQGRPLDVDLPRGPLMAAIEAGDLADVVDVLVDNVFAHTPEGSGFAVALSRDSAGGVRLEVVDDGTGLADPALTERGASGAGSTGLGLDIVRRAAAAAGGDLVVRRAVSGGTAVCVTLGPAG